MRRWHWSRGICSMLWEWGNFVYVRIVKSFTPAFVQWKIGAERFQQISTPTLCGRLFISSTTLADTWIMKVILIRYQFRPTNTGWRVSNNPQFNQCNISIRSPCLIYNHSKNRINGSPKLIYYRLPIVFTSQNSTKMAFQKLLIIQRLFS